MCLLEGWSTSFVSMSESGWCMLASMKPAEIIISVVKPIRCTNVSNIFYFWMTLYMFRTVFPSIIRSSRLYIQQQAFVKQILLSACADSSICLFDDGWKDHQKHVECHSKIKYIWYKLHLLLLLLTLQPWVGFGLFTNSVPLLSILDLRPPTNNFHPL